MPLASEVWEQWRVERRADFESTADLVKSRLRTQLRAELGIHDDELDSRIAVRIKPPSSVFEKVDRAGPTAIPTPKELESRVPDLLGSRVVLDYKDQAEHYAAELRHFMDSSSDWEVAKYEEQRRDDTGYRGIHLDVWCKEPTRGSPQVRCEIQIRTLLQHAWATWTHPLYVQFRVDPANFSDRSLRLMKNLADLLDVADDLGLSLRDVLGERDSRNG